MSAHRKSHNHTSISRVEMHENPNKTLFTQHHSWSAFDVNAPPAPSDLRGVINLHLPFEESECWWFLEEVGSCTWRQRHATVAIIRWSFMWLNSYLGTIMVRFNALTLHLAVGSRQESGKLSPNYPGPEWFMRLRFVKMSKMFVPIFPDSQSAHLIPHSRILDSAK